MKQTILNPVAVTGAGAGSENRLVPCEVLCAYVEFYPGVTGEKFFLEIMPGPDESFKKAKRRVRKEAKRLVEADREVMLHYNMNLSTEGFHFARISGLKIGGKLFICCSDENLQ